MSHHNNYADEFSVHNYTSIIESFLKRGYEVHSFTDADPKKRHLILRHDIDMSPEASLPIAKVEAKLNVSSTYFFLLRSELYNLFSPRNMDVLKELHQMGHCIGLHFDASLYGKLKTDLVTHLKEEAEILANWASAPVSSVSFHRPSKALQSIEGDIAGYAHAYDKKFFQDMGYCSDSRGGWHYNHPLEHPSYLAGTALQLLTHPIWWTEKGNQPSEKLRTFLDKRFDFLDIELAQQCNAHIPKSENGP